MAKYDDVVPVGPRRARWGRISLCLCLIIVAGALVWQVASHRGSTATGGGSGNADTSSPAAESSSSLTPPVPLTGTYEEIFEDHVAQGLHLTVAQVTEQLQAEPTPDLRVIGKQQGLAQDQLYQLVLNGLLTADDRMVSSSVWTRPQADEEMKYWGQQSQVRLINGAARWFV
jgi:hypothetical protein